MGKIKFDWSSFLTKLIYALLGALTGALGTANEDVNEFSLNLRNSIVSTASARSNYSIKNAVVDDRALDAFRLLDKETGGNSAKLYERGFSPHSISNNVVDHFPSCPPSPSGDSYPFFYPDSIFDVAIVWRVGMVFDSISQVCTAPMWILPLGEGYADTTTIIGPENDLAFYCFVQLVDTTSYQSLLGYPFSVVVSQLSSYNPYRYRYNATKYDLGISCAQINYHSSVIPPTSTKYVYANNKRYPIDGNHIFYQCLTSDYDVMFSVEEWFSLNSWSLVRNPNSWDLPNYDDNPTYSVFGWFLSGTNQDNPYFTGRWTTYVNLPHNKVLGLEMKHNY